MTAPRSRASSLVASSPAPNQTGMVSRRAAPASAISARRSSALVARETVGLVLGRRELVARAERRDDPTRRDCFERAVLLDQVRGPDQTDARDERTDHDDVVARATAASSGNGASDGASGEPMGQRWS